MSFSCPIKASLLHTYYSIRAADCQGDPKNNFSPIINGFSTKMSSILSAASILLVAFDNVDDSMSAHEVLLAQSHNSQLFYDFTSSDFYRTRPQDTKGSDNNGYDLLLAGSACPIITVLNRTGSARSGPIAIVLSENILVIAPS